jgi:transglutaminase-like putative cysteine protease
MRYQIQHVTRFDYSEAIRESVMELRMEPRTDSVQRCLEFDLSVQPEAVSQSYTDYLGNVVHHFDIPGDHRHLEVAASALIDMEPRQESAAHANRSDGWDELDGLRDSPEYWDWLHPSHFAQPSERLKAFAEKIHVGRRHDALAELKNLQDAIAGAITYSRGSTMVDSTIDECLEGGKGVCQDFTHLFIALARGIGVPCRYVSGYLFQLDGAGPRTAEAASHAWAEAYVPGGGWFGFDPSNRTMAGPDHVRGAIGRDYQDVPPTRGTFKGMATTKLEVRVSVTRA